MSTCRDISPARHRFVRHRIAPSSDAKGFIFCQSLAFARQWPGCVAAISEISLSPWPCLWNPSCGVEGAFLAAVCVCNDRNIPFVRYYLYVSAAPWTLRSFPERLHGECSNICPRSCLQCCPMPGRQATWPLGMLVSIDEVPVTPAAAEHLLHAPLRSSPHLFISLQALHPTNSRASRR